MRPAIVIAAAFMTLIAAGALADNKADKTRIKYLEIEDATSSEKMKMGDVDELWITMTDKYPLMIRARNNFSVNSLIFTPGKGTERKRFDFRFIAAEDDEILPPTLTEFRAAGLNGVTVSWNPVADATGYELRYVKQRFYACDNLDWDNVQACDGALVFGPDCNSTVIENLQYGATYRYAIRTLGADGKVSEWSERLPYFRDNKDFLLATAYRATPALITGVTDKTSGGFKVRFNLGYNRGGYPQACADSIEKYYTVKDGNFVADKLMIENSKTGQRSYIPLTDKMLEDGEIMVSGLDGDNHYEIALMNSAMTTEADAVYDVVEVDGWLTLSDYIQQLGAEYSQIKQWYEDNSAPVFDHRKSYVTGHQEITFKGVTCYKAVYDSVFTKTYPMFGQYGFDPDSNPEGFTLLLPTDDVVEAAMADAKGRLQKWDLDRDDKMLRDWVFGALLFDGIIPIEKLTAAETTDYQSVFGCQWRTSAQHLTGGVTELSNGIIYPVEKLHIPDNALIYRLKDVFCLYEDCSDEMKEECFRMTNMEFYKVSIEVAAWSPLEGVWPMHENRTLRVKPGNGDVEKPFCLDFTPVRKKQGPDGAEEVTKFLVPPGAYRLAFGSRQNQNLTIRVSVYAGGECVAQTPEDIYLGASTIYHFDRGATLPNRYPYGYVPADVVAAGGSSKAGNYDTDGGLLIEEVVIPDLNGDGSAVPIVIRIEGDKWGDVYDFTLNHWCLRPTADFY